MEDMYFKFSGRDTYKAVKEYIKNGLGLSKEDIEAEIRAYGEAAAERAINSYQVPRALNSRIDERIDMALNAGYGYTGHSRLKELIVKAVEVEVKKQVAEVIREKVKVMFDDSAK